MGVMGHFVGDGSQPLHTTMYFNGWFGPNPHGYTTVHTFHAWIDGGYFRVTGGLKLETLIGQIHPAEQIGKAFQPDETFRAVMVYLVDQNKLVEPLYQLEKDGELSGEGEKGLEGKAFLENQLVKGGQMLGNIWLTAWLEAPEDTYLKRQLEARRMENAGANEK
jgi:nitrogen fixation protein